MHAAAGLVESRHPDLHHFSEVFRSFWVYFDLFMLIKIIEMLLQFFSASFCCFFDPVRQIQHSPTEGGGGAFNDQRYSIRKSIFVFNYIFIILYLINSFLKLLYSDSYNFIKRRRERICTHLATPVSAVMHEDKQR